MYQMSLTNFRAYYDYLLNTYIHTFLYPRAYTEQERYLQRAMFDEVTLCLSRAPNLTRYLLCDSPGGLFKTWCESTGKNKAALYQQLYREERPIVKHLLTKEKRLYIEEGVAW